MIRCRAHGLVSSLDVDLGLKNHRWSPAAAWHSAVGGSPKPQRKRTSPALTDPLDSRFAIFRLSAHQLTGLLTALRAASIADLFISSMLKLLVLRARRSISVLRDRDRLHARSPVRLVPPHLVGAPLQSPSHAPRPV